MIEKTWINPVVRGSCDPFGACGGCCCKVKVYKPGNVEYTLEWCQHFDEPTRKCKIHEIKPNGCKTYPEVNTLVEQSLIFPGCGYYLEEDKND
jgi:Fe-S-cluster containining protein